MENHHLEACSRIIEDVQIIETYSKVKLYDYIREYMELGYIPCNVGLIASFARSGNNKYGFYGDFYVQTVCKYKNIQK